MQKEVGWILQEKYSGKETAGFRKDIERFEKGEPLDYIIGFGEFLGCKIDLSKKPLIPRDETEFWVEQAIEGMKDGQNLRILDMFSGSGCVGVAVLKYIKDATVVFAEKDKNCLEQIKINVKINKIDSKRYKIVQSDLFKNIKGTFDYILANPPYIPTTRKNKIQKSVLKYEPKIALFGGIDGLFYIKKFLTQAGKFLNANGKIYMEFDSIQKKEFEKLLKQLRYKNYEFQKDQYGKWRWVVVLN